MNWIVELDKYGYNILIDELVWHLEQGRSPSSVRLIDEHDRKGYEFLFAKTEPMFLKVNPAALRESWAEARMISGRFKQLAGMRFDNS